MPVNNSAGVGLGNQPHPAVPTQAQIDRVRVLIRSRRINQQIRDSLEAELLAGMTTGRIKAVMTWLQRLPIRLNPKATEGGISRIDPRDLD